MLCSSETYSDTTRRRVYIAKQIYRSYLKGLNNTAYSFEEDEPIF